jgi:lycopene beta-cyclase
VCAQPADHLVVGAGLSGLLLAHELLADASSALRLVVVDPVGPQHRPATYASWAQGPTALGPWSVGSWGALTVVGHDRQAHPVDLDGWAYTAVDWGRARLDLRDRLTRDRRVTLVPAPAEAVRDADDHAEVYAGQRWWAGRWVYDSRPPSVADLRAPRRRTPRGVALLQAFRGVWVHAHPDAFDPSAATLMDFSHDDGPDLGFSYVLPVSPTRAMVMAVRMGAGDTLPDPLPAVLRLVGDGPWRVEAEERGVTPLVVPAAPRRVGRHVLRIGQRGGRVRPSTGYAVLRILADTRAIARSLRRHGHPFAVPPDPPWQRGLDRIWLHALQRERAALEPAFLSLFMNASVDQVLRFLDGEARASDVLAVVRALPPRPFVRALLP